MQSIAPFARTSRPSPISWQPFSPSNMPTRAQSSSAHLLCSSPPTNNLHRDLFYPLHPTCASVLKVLLILSVNYALVKAMGGGTSCSSSHVAVQRWCVARERVVRRPCLCKFSLWIHSLGMLYYRASSPPYWYAFTGRLERSTPMSRHVSFNITRLRPVSFSIDYHCACNQVFIADVWRPPSHRLSLEVH